MDPILLILTALVVNVVSAHPASRLQSSIHHLYPGSGTGVGYRVALGVRLGWVQARSIPIAIHVRHGPPSPNIIHHSARGLTGDARAPRRLRNSLGKGHRPPANAQRPGPRRRVNLMEWSYYLLYTGTYTAHWTKKVARTAN